MALNSSAAATYQGNKINTASPAELTLMLYEGAVKFCNKAIHAIEQKEVEKAHINLVKAENIIMELRCTLDFKYPVAKEFDMVYDYIYGRLVQANLKKDVEIAQEALGYIREMRDTWKEVMRRNQIYVS